jgi:hypothetical protein
MMKYHKSNIVLLFVLISGVTHADVMVESPQGGVLTFSQKKKGQHYYRDAWGKIMFSNQHYSADLSWDPRYYIEDGSSKTSPSGKYLKITSVAGGYVGQEDGTFKYTDRAYCSVIDMTDGCIVSDWDGAACAYTWVGNKDVLASSEEPGAEIFDFSSFRPSINKVRRYFATMDLESVENIMRCDAPHKENINSYQEFAKKSKESKKIINNQIVNYLKRDLTELTIKAKARLFTTPDESNQTKAYLIAGDKVKKIQNSADDEWINIGYINKKGTPLVAWVKADTVAEQKNTNRKK